MRRLLTTTAVALAMAAAAQEPDLVLRISVALVQVDAVVTDARGRLVTALKAEDFEILQDGKPQKITHFNFVELPRPAAEHILQVMVTDRLAPEKYRTAS